MKKLIGIVASLMVVSFFAMGCQEGLEFDDIFKEIEGKACDVETFEQACIQQREAIVSCKDGVKVVEDCRTKDQICAPGADGVAACRDK